MSFSEFRASFSGGASGAGDFAGRWTGPEQVFVDPLFEGTVTQIPKGARGGLHVAVAGSITAGLYQNSEYRPDLTVFVDINAHAIDYLAVWGKLMESSETGARFWDGFAELRSMAQSPRDYTHLLGDIDPAIAANLFQVLQKGLSRGEVSYSAIKKLEQAIGGWSSIERYDVVKGAWQAGRIKAFQGDLSGDAVEVVARIAAETRLPITALYLSNVLDYFDDRQSLQFHSLLERAWREGRIATDAVLLFWGESYYIGVFLADYEARGPRHHKNIGRFVNAAG